MPVDGVGGGGIWSLDARLGEDHALSKAAASHMHTPSTNICSRTLFTNTQTCEHTHRSQTLPHTYLTCLAEFSNYAELCTFEHAWSTAEEERRIGMSGLLISDSPWQVCGKSVEGRGLTDPGLTGPVLTDPGLTGPVLTGPSSNWSRFENFKDQS